MISRFAMVIAAVILPTLLASCGGHGPELNEHHPWLEGSRVHQLHALSGSLLAATDDGLFLKRTGDESWRRAGLAGFDILDVAAFSDHHFLVSTYTWDQEGYPLYARWRTHTGGKKWHRSNDNFLGSEGPAAIRSFHFDAGSERLFATGTVMLGTSHDFGQTWQIQEGWFGATFSSIALNPATNEVWYGGQGPIENGILIRHALDTGVQTHYANLFPNPATYLGIRFDPKRADVVYASGEGGIAFTEDRGMSWSFPLGDVDYRFYYDVAIDPDNPSHLYTAGWDKIAARPAMRATDPSYWFPIAPQPLILEWSRDGGQSWKKYQYPAGNNFFGGVRSMILVEEEAETVWYLGLDGGGIKRFRVIDLDAPVD
jgi:hypothetical protein